MNIKISDEALTWFEESLPLDEGEALRFFGKTYGKTNVHDGFSVGIQIDDPKNYEEFIAKEELNGRIYFAAKEDEWFFSGYDLDIGFDESQGEPFYTFLKA